MYIDYQQIFEPFITSATELPFDISKTKYLKCLPFQYLSTSVT